MSDEKETLPPGELPHITDTDPPPIHPSTVVGDGVVYIKEEEPAAPETPPESTPPPEPPPPEPAKEA